MPTDQLRSMAAKYKKPLATVERYWTECKAGIPADTPNRWARVMACVKRRCAIRKKKQ